jgi:hypothetical protein
MCKRQGIALQGAYKKRQQCNTGGCGCASSTTWCRSEKHDCICVHIGTAECRSTLHYCGCPYFYGGDEPDCRATEHVFRLKRKEPESSDSSVQDTSSEVDYIPNIPDAYQDAINNLWLLVGIPFNGIN